MDKSPPSSRAGLLYGLAAYGLWGLAPIYFNGLVVLSDQHITAREILAQRIVWTILLLGLLLTLFKRWSMVATCFRMPPLRWPLLTTALLVALNWLIYIYGVATQQVLETSLGYFINPLFNVLLGIVFFHERPRRLQWLAIVLATVGVAGMTMSVGKLPWIALGLAISFGLYGLFRKKIPVDGLVGLSVETFMLAPLAVAYMIWLAASGDMALGAHGASCDILILLSGAVTAIPLMCFGQAARRLRLSTLGFLQYLAPTLQFLCAVLVLDEPLHDNQFACFAWIWAGLAVYSLDSVLARWYQVPQ
jgi:chloramphenicol-sensitive protein RarD